MLLLYRLALTFYRLVAWISSLFNIKAKYWVEGQKGVFDRLRRILPEAKKIIWIHASSVGEFEQGRPIIESIRRQEIECFILLTFFSPSGYQLRKNYPLADHVSYLPLDSPDNARRFVEMVDPKVAIFIKYDFWYYYLSALKQRSIPSLYVSCILRDNHFLLRPFGRFFLPVLQAVDHFYVQDEHSGALLKKIGIDQFTVAGDTRFDRVSEIAEKAEDIPHIEGFLHGEDQVMVVGSAWESDLKVIRAFILEMKDQMKFIIAPHNIDEQNLKPFLELPESVRYSELDEDQKTDSDILIIDNIGMLSRLYKYGKYALVGGAFNGTLHNVLEPAVYGIPVFFGKHKNNRKFLEAKGLTESGGGFSFSGSADLRESFKRIDSDDKTYARVAMAAGNFVKSGTGATSMIMKKIRELL